MPSVSEKQHRAMEAAAHGHSTLGIPQSVGKEFVAADSQTSADCAGILFRAPGPLYLLVQREDTGEWEQPGGHAEGDETPEQAAVRETVEEIGGCPEGIRWPVRRNEIPGAGGEYTCFLQNVPEPFKPQLNHEHTAWNWYAPDALPEKMHPEVARTIALVTGNELDIAKRMAAGELLSPQRFENMWLFDLRITGTGTSYRMALDEYVYRPPENFLTEEAQRARQQGISRSQHRIDLPAVSGRRRSARRRQGIRFGRRRADAGVARIN
jgi:8-oxo-dGTP pyrophosphatase MutT (NUDIX family)